MKWGLLGIRLGTLGVSLVILFIIVMGIFPLITGGIEVDFPEGQSGWTVQDDIISFHQPVRIYNGGFYDFDDLSIRLILEDLEGNLVTDYSNPLVDIEAGMKTTLDIFLPMDLNDFSENRTRDLVFNGTSFKILVELKTGYMMKLIWLRVNAAEEMEWDPLIRDFGIDREGIHYETIDDRILLSLPYFIDASSMLDGTLVSVFCDLRNGTASLGTTSDDLTLQGYSEGELSLILSEDASQWLLSNEDDLVLGFQVEVEGVSGHNDYPYHWYPPL